MLPIPPLDLIKEANVWPGKARGSWHEEEETPLNFAVSAEGLRVRKLYEMSGRN
jgi:hypothetical protein